MAGNELPRLSKQDYIILEEVRKRNPQSFHTNSTQFFLKMLRYYVEDARVWRISIMGETRGGKSEVAQSVSMYYTDYFNECLEKGVYKKLVIHEDTKIDKITFGVNNIMANQSNYIYTLRDLNKTKKLCFGQAWIIDEDKAKIGGLGSYSENVEIKNLNNIVAKLMQSEIWIVPTELLARNAPFGLRVYKKDTVNRVNWCLLYKIEMGTTSSSSHKLLGWVKVPLHNNEKLRIAYNMKKNEWIQNEVDGTGDPRIAERKKITDMLVNDDIFSAMSHSGKKTLLSKEQQLAYLDRMIMEGKSQNWNESEKVRIVMDARGLIMLKSAEDLINGRKDLLNDVNPVKNNNKNFSDEDLLVFNEIEDESVVEKEEFKKSFEEV